MILKGTGERVSVRKVSHVIPDGRGAVSALTFPEREKSRTKAKRPIFPKAF